VLLQPPPAHAGQQDLFLGLVVVDQPASAIFEDPQAAVPGGAAAVAHHDLHLVGQLGQFQGRVLTGDEPGGRDRDHPHPADEQGFEVDVFLEPGADGDIDFLHLQPFQGAPEPLADQLELGAGIGLLQVLQDAEHQRHRAALLDGEAQFRFVPGGQVPGKVHDRAALLQQCTRAAADLLPGRSEGGTVAAAVE